jgi:hypothetical protein
MPFIEQPEETARAVGGFLQGVPGAAG